MGKQFSSQRASKNRMREQLNELSVVLCALQHEVASQKTKSEDRAILIDDTTKAYNRQINACNEQISVIKEVIENSLEKLDNELQNYKNRNERLRCDVEEDKKNFYKLLNNQEKSIKELDKSLKNLQERTASFDEFTALSISFEKLKNRVEIEKDEVSGTVRKFVKERTTDLEKDILDLAEKFQETRGFMMELITLDLGHERDIVALKYRIDKLEECANRLSGKTDEVLPTPSLPDIARIRSVSSEATSISNQESRIDTGEMEDYQLKMSKISNVMKRMKNELHK